MSSRLCLLLLAVGVILNAAGVLTHAPGRSSRIAEFGAGLGSGAIILGCIGMIRLRKKPYDPRRAEIDKNDERLVKIRETSAQGTFYVTLIALNAAVLAFLFLDQIVACFITLGVMAVHVMCYFIMLIYYNKKL